MISVISASTSPRLEYVCEFIFTQQFGLPYEILEEANGRPSVYYGCKNALALNIPAHGLLFENDIKSKEVHYQNTAGKHFLFSNNETGFGFDIFSAIFYLITRYEEYLPHKKDRYGRYAHEQSIAFHNDFLAIPVVDQWLHDFKIVLLEKYPDLVFKERKTKFIPTYDIDIAYSFLGKGWLRNIGGFLKLPSLQRIRVLLGKEKDPYDCYDFLDRLHEEFHLEPICFFLLADRAGKYDKNINVKVAVLKNLIRRLAAKYEVGIHPSWQSYLDRDCIVKEKNLLQHLSGNKIVKSRQHYIKMKLPKSYQTLIEAGITEDFSMGYGTTNGFRASTANPFYWFDLQKNKATELLIHPFCVMDATSIFIEKKNAPDALVELQRLYTECKKYGAPCVAIFHNNLLDNSEDGEHRREWYEKFLKTISA